MTVTLVNKYYPVDYLALAGLTQPQAADPRNFWSSNEQLPPAIETLTFDLGSTRPVNFIDFEIIGKPIDFTIQYWNGSSWVTVTDNTTYNNPQGVTFIAGGDNPWLYIERHFNLVQTQKIMITFTRRTDPFPFKDSPAFQWSVDVRNLRIMNLIDSTTDFVADNGTDILGNSYRTQLKTYDATNVTDGNTTTYWKSQPNPSPFAVEALYIDMRQGSQTGIMSFEDQWPMFDLDTRSMADMETYYSNTVVIDDIYLDPITYGCSMHIYYSLDDTPNWDNKLWIPIPQHYILKKGYHALPTSIAVKYLKLEFSNLAPIPYNMPEYPTSATFTYRKFPTWVQNLFNGVYLGTDSITNFNTDPFDHVQIDPLALGFTQEIDLLNSNQRQDPSVVSSTPEEELQNFFQGIVSKNQESSTAQQETESQIKFNNTFIWQTDMLQQLDTSGALSRFTLQGESPWQAENALPVLAPPSVQSTSDLSQAQVDKQTPVMWFPFTCRHAYQVIQAKRSEKIAYYVGIKEFGAYRRDYTAQHDEDYYIESFDDTQNVISNDFLQNDWRWVVTP